MAIVPVEPRRQAIFHAIRGSEHADLAKACLEAIKCGDGLGTNGHRRRKEFQKERALWMDIVFIPFKCKTQLSKGMLDLR